MSKKALWISVILGIFLVGTIFILIIKNKGSADALNSMQGTMANISGSSFQQKSDAAIQASIKKLADKIGVVLSSHKDYQYSSLSSAQSTTIYGEINPLLSSSVSEIQSLLATLGYKNDTCKRVRVASDITIWKDDMYQNRIFVTIHVVGAYGEAVDGRDACVFVYSPLLSSTKTYEYTSGNLVSTDIKGDFRAAATANIISFIISAPASGDDLYAPNECCPQKPLTPWERVKKWLF